MRKHCGNCANDRNETNQFSEECAKCVSAILGNGETTDPSHWREKPQTNADRIRAMSDEELAVMFADHENKVAFEVCCSFGLPSVNYDFEESTSELLEWLKQPAEE